MMDEYGRGWGSGFDMMAGGWLVGLLMLFFGALVVAGIVLLVIYAVRSTSIHHGPSANAPAPPGAAGHGEAVAIVKRRYAAGEITKEQYDEMMRTLGGKRSRVELLRRAPNLRRLLLHRRNGVRVGVERCREGRPDDTVLGKRQARSTQVARRPSLPRSWSHRLSPAGAT